MAPRTPDLMTVSAPDDPVGGAAAGNESKRGPVTALASQPPAPLVTRRALQTKLRRADGTPNLVISTGFKAALHLAAFTLILPPLLGLFSAPFGAVLGIVAVFSHLTFSLVMSSYKLDQALGKLSDKRYRLERDLHAWEQRARGLDVSATPDADLTKAIGAFEARITALEAQLRTVLRLYRQRQGNRVIGRLWSFLEWDPANRVRHDIKEEYEALQELRTRLSQMPTELPLVSPYH